MKYIVIYLMVQTSTANYSGLPTRKHETRVVASQPKVFFNRDSALAEYRLDKDMIMPGSLVKASRLDSVKIK